MDDDLLLCAACKEYLDEAKDPRSLDCGHSYCFICLQHLYKECKEKIACLECQEETSLPTDGLSAIRCNPILVRHMRKRAQSNSTRDATTNQTQGEHQKTLREMERNDITILPAGTVFSEFRHEKKDALIYTLYYRKNGNEVEFMYSAALFIKLAEKFNLQELKGNPTNRSDIAICFVAIDTDSCRTEAIYEGIKENDIILWDVINYKILYREKIELLESRSSIAFIKYNSMVQLSKIEFTPSSRSIVKMGCPIQGCNNEKTERSWHCVYCLALLEYDHDTDRIFCDCGAWIKSLMDPSYDARCGNASHGFNTIRHSQLQGLLRQLGKVKDINILVLGETGVGKSTWINAIANYVTSSTLDEAMSDSKFQCLIESNIKKPSALIIRNFNKVKVEATNKGEDATLVGESVTKIPSSYLIPTSKYNVRLIDTPGVCDTKNKDEENCQNILYFLANAPFDEIHGICILIKCGETRVSKSFKYCVTQLFQQLHKSAADNLVLVFTFARISHFKKDDTFDILTRTLSEIGNELDKNIPFELDKNVFFLDNEVFNYLCLARANVEFDEIEVADNRRSWDKSKRESDRLFQYVESIEPYYKKNYASIYYARQVITRIIPPTLNLRLTMERNRERMEEAKRQHSLLSSELPDDNRIFFKKEEQISDELPSTSSLCNSCTMKIVVNDDLDEYKQEYHITKKICETNLGTWNLINRISWWFENLRSKKCPTCGCPEHNHERTASNAKIIIKYCCVYNIQDLLIQIDDTRNNLRKITTNSAMLSFFLKNSVLTGYDDLILNELKVHKHGLIFLRNKDTVKDKDAEDYLARNIELARKVKKEHKDQMTNCVELLKPEKVFELVDELYLIPDFGPELKRRVERDERARAAEVSKAETILKRAGFQRIYKYMIK